MEFTGQPKRETVWDAARQNLPRPVQPGVTYRDIGIQLGITSVFADIDRIVAEALGEVPPTNDNVPAGDPPMPPAAAHAHNDNPAPTTSTPARPASPAPTSAPARHTRRTGRH